MISDVNNIVGYTSTVKKLKYVLNSNSVLLFYVQKIINRKRHKMNLCTLQRYQLVLMISTENLYDNIL